LPLRNQVKEVTLDMAKNMESAIKASFPMAKVVTDRFHVVKLVIDALQHIRIKHRWIAIDKENEDIVNAENLGIKYKVVVFENEDTPKQLLARSRHLLAKSPDKWTENQKERAFILFREYPQIKKAYQHVMMFRNIYENKLKSRAIQEFKLWIEKTRNQRV
jgi:transposase